jgi:glycogen debranching enzyme
MAKCGLTQEAASVLNNLFQAAMYFDLHRMPELFCGFSRKTGEGPVLYPVACAPQAWAAASMFLLLQACLGLHIDGPGKRLILLRPVLPEALGELHITHLDVGGSFLDIVVKGQRHEVTVTVMKNDGNVKVVLE